MAHVDAEREAAGRATKSKKGLADSDLGKGLRLLIRAADCEQRSGACCCPGVRSLEVAVIIHVIQVSASAGGQDVSLGA